MWYNIKYTKKPKKKCTPFVRTNDIIKIFKSLIKGTFFILKIVEFSTLMVRVLNFIISANYSHNYYKSNQ